MSTTEIYTLSLHDALPICDVAPGQWRGASDPCRPRDRHGRSEEHTSELQSHLNLVCRLLLEKKKTKTATPASSQRKRRTTTKTHPRNRTHTHTTGLAPTIS